LFEALASFVDADALLVGNDAQGVTRVVHTQAGTPEGMVVLELSVGDEAKSIKVDDDAKVYRVFVREASALDEESGFTETAVPFNATGTIAPIPGSPA
jgi:hypothetical protein